MIVSYIQTETGIEAVPISEANVSEMQKAIWIDLVSPTKKEEKLIEMHLHLEIPTKQEMAEIELSSRLYVEDDIFYMTATIIAQSGSREPKAEPVTFILSNQQLITVRYIAPQAFDLFISRLLRFKKEYDAKKIFVALLESTADRLADILETVSHHFDEISQRIFRSPDIDSGTSIDHKKTLQAIGANGDLGTKVRESLVSFNRLLFFFEQTSGSMLDKKLQSRLRTLSKDIVALSDYASFISVKVNFLLDATLGMINIEQNNIIKIFSVAAVIFLPPTLIASIYGMNFKDMPELHLFWGYPFALVLMLISAWLPYRYFKKKKWL